ncbi:PucR family transcriptional regulator [Streptacidiphilus monticola]
MFRGCATGRVGLSPVYQRLDQTMRTLRYAQVALESLPQGSAAVRQLDDAPLTGLVLANLDSTRRAVNRVLGGVLCLPDNERTTLLATAQAWLQAHGSAAEAAQALYCHPNTVRYRLRRLEEHLRGPLEDPLVLGELAVALDAVGTFPGLLHEHRPEELSTPDAD